MMMTFTNNAPVSAIAATGVSTVMSDARFGAASPAVVSPLTAKRPQLHQVLADQALILGMWGYNGPETEQPKSKLGGFRGVPPRGRPV